MLFHLPDFELSAVAEVFLLCQVLVQNTMYLQEPSVAAQEMSTSGPGGDQSLMASDGALAIRRPRLLWYFRRLLGPGSRH
jgi:hypothetical protein